MMDAGQENDKAAISDNIELNERSDRKVSFIAALPTLATTHTAVPSHRDLLIASHTSTQIELASLFL